MNPGLYRNGLRFLASFGMTRGCREQGMGNKGGTAALVPHPSLLRIAVIPNVAPRNEESL